MNTAKRFLIRGAIGLVYCGIAAKWARYAGLDVIAFVVGAWLIVAKIEGII